MFNFIDVIVILIILVSVFVGYKKGFIKMVIKLCSFFVALGLALLFYKPMAVILTENTVIDDWIVEKIVSKEVSGDIILDNDISNAEEVFENTENDLMSQDDLWAQIMHFPAIVTQNINIENLGNEAKREIAIQLSELIMNLLSLIIIYIIVKLTLSVAAFVLDGIMQIPVLKQLNEVLGMTIGAVIGFSQVYIVFAVITFISSISDIQFVIEAIKESAFARILFENNVIINLLF